MSRRIACGAVAALAAGMLSLAAAALWAQAPRAAKPVRIGGRTLGAAKQYRNLTLVPVYDTAAKATGEYVTLDEGLRSGVVTVRESSGGGSVNTLYVSNAGRRPVYIMGGEVVLGGQQDRCLGRDAIIKPGARAVPVTVFCVEHGRWTGRSEFAETAKTVASADIRAQAQDAAFMASLPAARPAQSASRSARTRGPAVAQQAAPVLMGGAVGYRRVSEAQQQVWDRVARKNAAFRAAPTTGTYREVLNGSGGEAARGIDPYVKAFAGSVGADRHLVGVVAAVNGSVVAADIFGDPGLFHKLWPKLLRSYAADAAQAARSAARPYASITPAQAKSFLIEAAGAKSRAEGRDAAGMMLRLESGSTLSYQLRPSRPAAGSGGGVGGALHESVLRK